MSTGDEEGRRSPGENEPPDGENEAGAAAGDHVVEEEADAAAAAADPKPKGKAAPGGSRKASDFPVLVNRRGKVVNGSLDPRDKVRKRGSREPERRTEDNTVKDRDGRNTDSGLGRTSAEGVDSPMADDPAGRRKVWEVESGESDAGARDGERGSRLGRAQAARKEEVARLEKELEQELRYRDTIQWSVDVLQQSVEQLQQQLDGMTSGQEEDGGEFKLRYEAQLELNDKLEEQTVWYLEEVEKTRDKVKRGQEYTYDQDLDKYNEFELLRMKKCLERERNNLYSDFRNKSWLLDNHSKEYYHLKELIRAYTVDLTMVNRSLEHLWRQRSVSNDPAFAGGSTPVTSPGGLKWSSGQSGIRPSHRILDPRKGPIRKTAGVRSLPRLDQEAIDFYEERSLFRKARSRSRGRPRVRAKSLDVKKNTAAHDVVAPLSPMLRGKVDEAPSLRSSSGVFDESYEASNEASTTASVELSSDKL